MKNRLLMQIYADVTAPPAQPDRLRAGPGARLGDARRGRRRRLPGHARRGGGDGPQDRRGAYLPDADRATPTTTLYAEYRTLHDYFGRGGNDVMHRLRAIAASVRQHAVAAGDRRRAAGDHVTGALREVCALHAELVRYGLVAWTSGNVSARVPGDGPDGDQAERRGVRAT